MAQLDSLISTLLGALIGGAASLTGSIYVGRRDLTRNTRIRMFNELIPPLQEEVRGLITESHNSEAAPELHEDFYIALAVLSRAGVIAGRHDRSRTDRLIELVSKQRETYRMYDECSKSEPPSVFSMWTLFETYVPRRPGEAEGKRNERIKNHPKTMEHEAKIANWEAQMQRYREEFWAIDHAVLNQLNDIYRFLDRKIR